MSGVDEKLRDSTLRREFTGAEDLDRVLIHLREVRERVAQPDRNGRKRRRRESSPDENVSFGHTPEYRPSAHSEADTQPAENPQANATTDAGPPVESIETPAPRHAESQPEPVSAPDNPGTLNRTDTDALTERISDVDAMTRAMARLRRAASRMTASRAIPAPMAAPRIATPELSAPRPASSPRTGELIAAVLQSRSAFRSLAVFSFAINILMLAGPLFMLQVYDRVMTSHSMPTLVALFALTAAIYGVIGLLELVRSRVIVRIGVELDQRTSDRVFAATLRRSLAQPGASTPALRELDQLRQFIAGSGPLTFFDAPWTPVYLLVIFLTHWTLGIVASIGALLLLAIAWVSEIRGREPLAEAGKAGHLSLELAESGQRNAEAIGAMGMLDAYRARWQLANRNALAWHVLAADRLSGLSSLSRFLRLLLQSLMLAVGAALAVNGFISAGSIIAATIIFGRALAPVEQIVTHWRSFVKARESFAKLDRLLGAYPEPPRRMSLPPPKGHLETRDLKITAPDGTAPILAGVNLRVAPGEMLAIIGPSASGKSTLVRALVGLWPIAGGEILLDGARLDQRNADELGRHIGYLPQSVELFAGTVRENIARFQPAATDDDVSEAARAAHVHDMILALPKGYETELGAFGAYLSAGQRQRIGLARALFGNPALVVLDEPNANLDRTGDEALAAAIDGMRARGRSVVLVSHRVQAIGKADRLLYLESGAQRAFGPREEVLRFLQQGRPAPERETTTNSSTSSRRR